VGWVDLRVIHVGVERIALVADHRKPPATTYDQSFCSPRSGRADAIISLLTWYKKSIRLAAQRRSHFNFSQYLDLGFNGVAAFVAGLSLRSYFESPL
jgi:hypothetical protein